MSKIGEQISAALQQFEEDQAKFEAGNKAAGTPARKALMEIKKIAGEGRKELNAMRATKKQKPAEHSEVSLTARGA
jgi:hypothetical protein